MVVTARVLKGELPEFGEGPLYREKDGRIKYCTLRMRNHPCAQWVRTDLYGFRYTYELLDAVLKEFHFRFREEGGEPHATAKFLSLLPPPDMGKLFPHRRRQKPVPLAVKDATRWDDDPIRTYRNFYLQDKARFATWTKRCPPIWWSTKNKPSSITSLL